MFGKIVKNIVEFGGAAAVGLTINGIVTPIAQTQSGLNKVILYTGACVGSFMSGYLWTQIIDEIDDAFGFTD